MRPTVVLLMGVAGAGKTTVGRALAAHLGWDFQDADDLHPAANVAKMAAGRPLDDEDRAPWLAAVADWVAAELAAHRCGVIACSALKRAYRQRIAGDRPGVRLVLLDGDRALIAARMATRPGHFMPPALLDSQFAAFERPGPDETALVVDAALPLADQVASIAAAVAGA